MARTNTLAALRAGIRATVGEMGDTAQREADRTENLHRAERSNWATVPHESIVPDPDQPRKFFDEEKLRGMAESIRAVGLREPLRVYPVGWGGRFRILDGQRRWHALAMLLEEGLEQFREVAVLVDEAPADEAELRVDQLVTSLHKEVFVPLETAAVLLEIAVKAGGGEPLSAARVAERFGFNAKSIERHLKVARGLGAGERAFLLEQYPKAPLDPLEKLVGWLHSAAGSRLDEAGRALALQLFAEHRPAGRNVEALLRPLAVKKPAGRPPKAQFRSGPTGDGGFAVNVRIPPGRAADDVVLAQAERELERALAELKRFRQGRAGGQG
jgi:ParB/RepB/Spo0J family partition protein